MRVRALIIDLFGTLIPKWPRELSVERKRRMALASGVKERVFRDAWAARRLDRELGRVSLKTCIAEVLENVAQPARRETVARLIDIWIGPVAEHLRLAPRPDAIATLQQVRDRGLKIGLLSNAGPEIPGVFSADRLSDLVDVAVFSCSVGVAKPDRRIYLSACEALAVSPANCVYVGDGGDQELQGALRVGMTPVLLRIESEIEKEGLPPGAAAWKGPVIRTFTELWDHLGVADRARRQRPHAN